MMHLVTALGGAQIFDGTRLHDHSALLIKGMHVLDIIPLSEVPSHVQITQFDCGVLAPGYVDLQVNGGGGVNFNERPSVQTLTTIAKAHTRLGATSILPTLITDTKEKTHCAIKAAVQACDQEIPGIAGLHLEGPHLSVARKGAHEAEHVRLMEINDETLLLSAANQLPILKVTVAPESVSLKQMHRLSDAGILLSLGHTDASHKTILSALDHGASCTTHLFNAMSQLGSREPGLVGTTLGDGRISAGLIADMIHVHPQVIKVAMQAKRGPGRIFLVSDAMAVAGSNITSFKLNGRLVSRHNGRLTLEDNSLAGADLDLTMAVKNMVNIVNTPLETALEMVTSIPARLIGRCKEIGSLVKDSRADIVYLDKHLNLSAVWQGGSQQEIEQP